MNEQTISNPGLVQALALLHAQNTPEHQNQVLHETVSCATFLAPVVLPDQSTQGDTDAIQFRLINAQDGRSFFPAFTDWNELRKFTGPAVQKTVALTFDHYAAMLASNPKMAGFVVNPMGQSLTLDRELVAKLAAQKQQRAGYTHQMLEKDTKIVLGEAKDCPQALLDAVRLAARDLPQVKRLFLRLMSRADQPQSSYLIVVDHSGDRDQVLSTIADAARPHLKNRQVSMVPFESNLGQAAAADTQPFFARA